MDTNTYMHFADNTLINPVHPITINLIGTGGTGSQMLTQLARMNHALNALDHPGFSVYAYDQDIVTEANLGRQLFADAEIGLPKAVALINRVNGFFGTNWKAVTKNYEAGNIHRLPRKGAANIFISCVDTVPARFDIESALTAMAADRWYSNITPLYWMDLGNSRDTGQAILSTLRNIPQPESKRFTTVSYLPKITEEFGEVLKTQPEDNTPSCSLAEALDKQDLFVNSTLANLGASLIWNLFRNGMTANRGFFMNLKNFITQPLKVSHKCEQWNQAA